MDLLVIVQVHQDQSEDLAKVKTRDHLLECLLAWARRVVVDGNIVFGTRQDLVLIIKGTPLTVDSHGGVGGKVHVCQLRDGATVFHVSGIASGSEDTTNLHLGVGVCGSNQCSCGVVDQG